MRFGPVLHALLVTGAAFLTLIPALPARADPAPGSVRFEWARARTVQGCFVHWLWTHSGGGREADVVQNATFSYEGTGCTPDRVLNGEGTLTVTQRWPPSPHSSTQIWRGRFVDGAREGEFPDPLTGGAPFQFSGGCELSQLEHRECTPIGRTRFAAGGSEGGAASTPSPAPASAPASAPGANGDVFDQCTRLEGPDRSGLQHIWQLRNVCQTRVSLSYCLRADFEAAGDYNLCTRREYRTHSVAPGATVHFAFNLMPPGTNLSDGRQVTHNTLYVRGYACADDSSPRVHFEDGQLVFRGC